MSSAAAVGGGPSSTDDRVYCAVVAAPRGSLEEVRGAIEGSPSAAAAVNQAGANGETPLSAARRLFRHDLVFLLLEDGAEGAGDGDRFEAVWWCVEKNDLAALQRLIERGVSVDMASEYGITPVMSACSYSRATTGRCDLTLEIFRCSSVETRRAVSNDGWSAVDYLFYAHGVLPLQPWHGELVSELLAAGAPVQTVQAARVMRIAAAHAARREGELAACLSMGHDWRAQETFAGLSMDMGELREAQQMVAARRARLEALERELGSETDSGSSESGSDSEEGEATGSGDVSDED